MKNKISFSVLLMILMVSPLINFSRLYAQTSGTLTFTVSLASHSAGYGTKHVTAVWLEDVSGAFVKTKYRMASGHTLNSHLPVWKANSGSNVIDATTGSTLSAYTPITISWNGTNVSAALVPDGVYRVYTEVTWDDGSSNHDTTSVVFTKGAAGVHLTPDDKTNFKSMTLDWLPSNVGTEDIKTDELFSVYPNPVTNQSIIKYSINDLSDVTISLYDINGKLVNVLFDDNQDAGDYSLNLYVKGKIEPGIYFIKMYTGKSQHVARILVSE